MKHADRVARVRAQMKQTGVDLLALPPSDDLFYLLGYSPHADERPCYLFLTQGEVLFVVPELNAGQARAHVDLPLLVYGDAEGPGDALRRAADLLGPVERLCVSDTMRADFLLLLQARWPRATVVPGADVMAPVRIIKSPEEIEAMRRSAATADVATDAAFAACRPGVTEIAVAAAIREAFGAQNVPEVLFATVGGGPHSAFPHHAVTDRPLRAGEPVLVDLGGRLGGYASDITRMAFLGEPSPRYRQIHDTVEHAVRAALDAIRPGVPLAAVDRAARGVIEAAGYGGYFTHRTGHGIGIAGHEPPSVTHTNQMPIQAGMVFSVEPGIYLEGEFGVRLEEVVVVTASGPERFSRLPREVRVL
ncbi:MAG: Xaa-Pro peptidase family protein [Armatimonadota bacterium]|nr:Xaa-Pro peptidase family protein [Armatimonadota bacterium]MDR7485815.1 Xaa-Pro peptidase family protein [Armatimonadota bacterium]MDR7532112.1 Xaa-Pro peptidase family protein [Armatimonadota bacterium]MDR7536701.1 Xaa-Pro peptidase family protein [Armatimonadota bacterium]